MGKDCLMQVKNTLIVYKKKIWSIVILVTIFGMISAGAHAMFQVRGVVTGVDNNSITVTNFFRTQTVDMAGSSVNVSAIKPGYRIKIQKNLQGNILYVRTSAFKEDEEDEQHKDKHHRDYKDSRI
ncbi:hypothetical protein Ga0466249_000451 [Sporomusaceae bacterium BoRhaA]|uniref:hypothetical protein n=1 Tax=Pelorhabdus rhamnosifermentans TaxID=2772457 RepID=UPI001C0633EA|nr:hypothetical protein [Pelorhabdus rhamnosifermentans]MBU2699372.1 hypothetical protein [Pelorhabdus rhamnosifermentans]